MFKRRKTQQETDAEADRKRLTEILDGLADSYPPVAYRAQQRLHQWREQGRDGLTDAVLELWRAFYHPGGTTFPLYGYGLCLIALSYLLLLLHQNSLFVLSGQHPKLALLYMFVFGFMLVFGGRFRKLQLPDNWVIRYTNTATELADKRLTGMYADLLPLLNGQGTASLRPKVRAALTSVLEGEPDAAQTLTAHQRASLAEEVKVVVTHWPADPAASVPVEEIAFCRAALTALYRDGNALPGSARRPLQSVAKRPALSPHRAAVREAAAEVLLRPASGTGG